MKNSNSNSNSNSKQTSNYKNRSSTKADTSNQNHSSNRSNTSNTTNRRSAKPLNKMGSSNPHPHTGSSVKVPKSTVNDGTEKLQKVLANLGHGSRREIETLIVERKISVDGKIATLGDRVDVNKLPKIRINGYQISVRPKEKEVCRVLAYYKPEGEICSRSDPEGRATVFERLPKLKNARWINIGRLDINTSGLLLFTTDGELANRLMHPRHEVEREYAVRVFGKVTDDQLNQLRRGVQLEDGPAAFKSVKAQGGEGLNQWFNVLLTEGRNREVRRMWEAVGVQVSRLLRVRYGDISLPKFLSRGAWIELNLASVNYLRESVGLITEEKSFKHDDNKNQPKRRKPQINSSRRSKY